MNYLDGVTPELAEAALVEVARHAPLDVEIGLPYSVSHMDHDTIVITMTNKSVWFVSADTVAKFVDLRNGANTMTYYRWRVLTDHQVVYDSELGN